MARARLWNWIDVDCEASVEESEELIFDFYRSELEGADDAAVEERPAPKWRRELEAELSEAAADPMAKWIMDKAAAAAAAAAGPVRGDQCDKLLREKLLRALLNTGLDAGICESRWVNTVGVTAGRHQYIDAVVGKRRYIVEINLAAEFEIARPTKEYEELVRNCLPRVFVGRPKTLEAVIRILSTALEESIKAVGMHLPPWRRIKYMHQKWLGDYSRRPTHLPYFSHSIDANGIFLRGM